MASLLFYRGSSKQKKEEESNSLNIESLWCESSHSDLFLCRHSTRKRASLCQEPNGLEATLMIKLIIPYSTQNDDSSWLSTNAEMLIKYYSQIVHSYPSVTFDACELIMAFCLRGQSSINWRKLIFFCSQMSNKSPIQNIDYIQKKVGTFSLDDLDFCSAFALLDGSFSFFDIMKGKNTLSFKGIAEWTSIKGWDKPKREEIQARWRKEQKRAGNSQRGKGVTNM